MTNQEIIDTYRNNHPIMTALTGEEILHEFIGDDNIKYLVIKKENIVSISPAAFISTPVTEIDMSKYREDY